MNKLNVLGPPSSDSEVVLTADALAFVEKLAEQFSGRREALLAHRSDRQRAFDSGERPRFLESTRDVRGGDWRVAPLPADLLDRRVEITGPVDRKMIINALNSGANVFMADFEDATSPTWDNLISGQRNLMDAIRRRINFEGPGSRTYSLNQKTAVLMVRPRGWHLPERNVLLNGAPIAGAFFDFGLYFFHNARELIARGSGPYFYLPKLEGHLEARLWNDVFHFAQAELNIPPGTIKATVLIETLPAAFEMDEILYELREHSAGLNCGRWDYIFSFIKKLREDPSALLPDRAQVTMDKAFLAAYVRRLIATCHRRGVHAMGGMAAQIPIKNDPTANEAAMAKVRADKRREVTLGHDGTWVAHPGLIALTKEIFDQHMPAPNQISVTRELTESTEASLLEVPTGTRTLAGFRHNIRVGVQYLAAWLDGLGCVPLYGLMEDAATAEIARAQIWQWLRHEASLEDGTRVTRSLFSRILGEEVAALDLSGAPGANRMEEAVHLFDRLSTSPTFEEFLTLPAYESLHQRSR